jgi:hypothetical protein
MACQSRAPHLPAACQQGLSLRLPGHTSSSSSSCLLGKTQVDKGLQGTGWLRRSSTQDLVRAKPVMPILWLTHMQGLHDCSHLAAGQVTGT